MLLPDPVVPDLNALDLDARRQYLCDMTVMGDALEEVTEAYHINYEILGSLDPALHTHIFPRELRASRPFDLERDRELVQHLADAIRSKTS